MYLSDAKLVIEKRGLAFGRGALLFHHSPTKVLFSMSFM
jgi:hypothetical protein